MSFEPTILAAISGIQIPDTVTHAAAVLLLAALLLALWRLVRGPEIVNRVVALELVAGTCMGIFVLFSVQFREPLLLDAALAIAVISFLGTVALARYLEKGALESRAGKEEPQE